MNKFVYVLDFTPRIAGSSLHLGAVVVLVSRQRISSEKFQALVNAAIAEGVQSVQDVTDFLVDHHGFQKIDFVRATAKW